MKKLEEELFYLGALPQTPPFSLQPLGERGKARRWDLQTIVKKSLTKI